MIARNPCDAPIPHDTPDNAYRRGYDHGLTEANALYARARAVMTPIEVQALTREIQVHPDLDLLRHRVETAENRHRGTGARPNLAVIR